MLRLINLTWLRKALASAAITASITLLAHGAVVVTPGTMAGYNYFPASGESSSSGSSSEDVSTLQRCVWTPATGDQTVTVGNLYGYTKDITLYYTMVGGDGGKGPAGGGGGSSAIVLNGAVAALGKGGDGGTAYAPTAKGTFKIKAGDQLRFVTGGSGGDTYIGTNFTIGGGGGAGYTGGGGGGSLTSRAATAGDSPALGGKGGAVLPGIGGFVGGGLTGTAGNGMQGGISTYPDGSTSPVGPDSANGYWTEVKTSGWITTKSSKYPALPNRMGSPICSNTGNVIECAGGGGKLGKSGGFAVPGVGYMAYSCNETLNAYPDIQTIMASQCDSTGYTSWAYWLPHIEIYPEPSYDLKLTRTYPDIPVGYISTAGSLTGQIVTMYQAPVCGIFE